VPLPVRLLLVGLGGAVVGLLGSVAHQSEVDVGGHVLPVGLVLALALVLTYAVLLRAVGVGLLGGVLATLGWFVVVWTAGTRRSEGDVVVPGNLRGQVWLWAGFVLLLLVSSLPARRRAPRG
jgi:hypothetical protein